MGPVRRGLVIGAVVLVVVVSGTAFAAVTGSPDLSAHVTDNRVSPGETTTLDVVLLNDGEVDTGSVNNPSLDSQVTTARGVTLALDDGSVPFDVRTGRQAIGSVPVGASDPVPFSVVVPRDVDSGRYHVPVDVAYRYTEYVSEGDGLQRHDSAEESFTIPVVVEERARFDVATVRSTVTEDDAGTVEVTVTNDGDVPARDARFALTSASPHLTIDGAETGTRVVDNLSADESATLSYRVTPTASAATTNYSLQLAADYETPDGRTHSATPEWLDVRPSSGLDATFSTTDVALPTGMESELNGTVTLQGDGVARDAVVVVSSPPTAVRLAEARVPVGDLEAGETADFSLPITVTPDARAGDRSMTVALEYRDPDRSETRRTVGSSVVGLEVTDPDRVSVRGVNASVNPDADTRLVVEIENVGDSTFEDVQAGVTPRPPFTSSSPTAYVPELAPGDTARVAFHVSVSDDAVVGSQSLPVNVTAETPDGDRVTTGGHLVQVAVVEPESAASQTTLFVAGVVIVAIVLAAGYWWLQQ